MIGEGKTHRRRGAACARAFPRLRGAVARRRGSRLDPAADAAHRAILHALGLPPFVSRRTLRMMAAEMEGGRPGVSRRALIEEESS